MATFLHTRRFLAYHQDRFKDVSLLLANDKGIVGLFPAALDPAEARTVVSHPGITYGGLLHSGKLHGEKMVTALVKVTDYYAQQGFDILRYKAVPHIYHRRPSGDDLYALFRTKAACVRRDLSCAIDLLNGSERSSRRRRSLKKALRSGIQVSKGPQFISQLWKLIAENYHRRLNARPVHTEAELRYLYDLFPRNIRFVAGILDGEIIAGVVLFYSSSVAHAQYIASSEVGYDVCALDAVFEYAIEQAKVERCRFFDFGTSNNDEGRYLSTNVYNFKTEFGAGGVVHEFYEFDLTV